MSPLLVQNTTAKARQCHAGAEDLKGCLALFRQDLEDKFGLLGIVDMEWVTGSSQWSRATCSDGGG